MSDLVTENLPLVTTAPNGIKRLRGLILELAVRGKLVPPENGTVETTVLSDLGNWAIGSGFPKNEQGLTEEKILFAKVSDMNLPGNEREIRSTNNTISRESAQRLRIKIHPAGTVVFPKIGGAIATNKRRVLVSDTAIDNNCLGITPRTGVTTDWLYTVLLSIDMTLYQAGTSVPAVAQGALTKVPVALPPLPEQHRIVARVDELMTLCDRLEAEQTDAAEAHVRLVDALLATLTASRDTAECTANWQRLSEHFDTLFTTEASIAALKQTVLQLAVMGRLVAQDPTDEPASELLKRIKAEKTRLVKEGKIRKPKAVEAVREDERPFAIPLGWEWIRLGQIGEWGAGATPLRTKPEYYGGIMPWFKSGELSADLIWQSQESVSELALKECSLRRNQAGDVLIAMYGATIGKCAILACEATTNQAVCACTPATGVFNRYLLLLLKDLLSNFMAQGAGAAQPNISREKIIATVASLPPTPEQHRIVAKVDELMALCDSLQADLQNARSTETRIAEALTTVG